MSQAFDNYVSEDLIAEKNPKFDLDKCFVGIDIAKQPSITIVDLYTKEGKHLKRTMSTEDGTIISEEGPDPGKDIAFMPADWAAKFGRIARELKTS